MCLSVRNSWKKQWFRDKRIRYCMYTRLSSTLYGKHGTRKGVEVVVVVIYSMKEGHTPSCPSKTIYFLDPSMRTNEQTNCTQQATRWWAEEKLSLRGPRLDLCAVLGKVFHHSRNKGGANQMSATRHVVQMCWEFMGDVHARCKTITGTSLPETVWIHATFDPGWGTRVLLDVAGCFPWTAAPKPLIPLSLKNDQRNRKHHNVVKCMGL